MGKALRITKSKTKAGQASGRVVKSTDRAGSVSSKKAGQWYSNTTLGTMCGMASGERKC
jgi:hypothetical protein